MQATIIYTVFEPRPIEVVTLRASDLGLWEDASPAVWLDRIYRTMNYVDGTELCIKLGVRSLSVGDIVRFESHDQAIATYRCEPTGWRQFYDEAPQAPT